MGRPQIVGALGAVSASTRLLVVGSLTPKVSRFAYVAGNADNTLSAYTVNSATGQLRTNGYLSVGRQPSAVVVEPRGKFVYVVNSGEHNVATYAITQANGSANTDSDSPSYS